MKASTQEAKQRLATDLRNVIQDTELLLREVGDELNEKGKQARARLASTIESAKGTCHDLQEKTAAAARGANEFVHENPYKSVGAAFGIGILIGVLVSRR